MPQMAKLMIVPTEDYKVLNKYLAIGQPGYQDVVLLSQELLDTFPEFFQERAKELAKMESIPYEWEGGDSDVEVNAVTSLTDPRGALVFLTDAEWEELHGEGPANGEEKALSQAAEIWLAAKDSEQL